MKLCALVFLSLAMVRGCVPFDADRITGKDLAAVHPDFAKLTPALDLGPAPLPGSHRVLRFAELSRIAREQGIVLAPDSPRELCFERSAATLTPDRLHPVLAAALRERHPEARIEILDYSRTPLPQGTLEFPITGLGANGFWRGRLAYGDRRSIPLWVRVRISDPAGQLLAITPVSQAEIARGQTVRVEVTSGGVLLAFDAAAESSGHVGEAVTVRNPANGQRFRAVVEAKGKAVIRK